MYVMFRPHAAIGRDRMGIAMPQVKKKVGVLVDEQCASWLNGS